VRIGVRMAKYLPWHPDKLGAWTRARVAQGARPRFPKLVAEESIEIRIQTVRSINHDQS